MTWGLLFHRTVLFEGQKECEGISQPPLLVHSLRQMLVVLSFLSGDVYTT